MVIETIVMSLIIMFSVSARSGLNVKKGNKQIIDEYRFDCTRGYPNVKYGIPRVCLGKQSEWINTIYKL
jgi:hypothetical protein